MPEDRDALVAHYRQMQDDVRDAIDGLTNEQMTEATIDGGSVKDHLAHLALWHEIRASEVTRISSGYESAWRLTDAQTEAFNATMYELRRDFSLSQAKWELTQARERLFAALAQANVRGLNGALYGEAGLRSEHEAEHAGWIRRWRAERGYADLGDAERAG
ncbi:MAG: hypothetical protein DWG77_01605 [Chloroflexi bacterium]|nr:hypothetical protein [Chloroflexota bacterium]